MHVAIAPRSRTATSRQPPSVRPMVRLGTVSGVAFESLGAEGEGCTPTGAGGDVGVGGGGGGESGVGGLGGGNDGGLGGGMGGGGRAGGGGGGGGGFGQQPHAPLQLRSTTLMMPQPHKPNCSSCTHCAVGMTPVSTHAGGALGVGGGLGGVGGHDGIGGEVGGVGGDNGRYMKPPAVPSNALSPIEQLGGT